MSDPLEEFEYVSGRGSQLKSSSSSGLSSGSGSSSGDIVGEIEELIQKVQSSRPRLKKERDEEQSKLKSSDLKALLDISQAINSTLVLDEILQIVMKKAVEPAFNFYKIEAQKVIDKAGVMTGLLVFYVAYTMWWGFAIFYMFDGIGLTMKKAKVKREV